MSKYLLTGCEASAEAAIHAGCKFYAGYPITPQNRFPEYMSKRLPEEGGIFIQAESEISAINMVFGASVCGFRALTSSSSPGISLKQEGISYLAGCQLPAVIINMNRGGPGLGDVTPSQSDYFQATRGGGHGDYRTIVLAPWTVQELYDLTYIAFDIADKYRNPVLILADGVLAQIMESVKFKKKKKKLPIKKWALTGCKGRKPNSIKSLFLTPGVLEKHNWKLYKKYKKIEEKEIRYEKYFCDDVDNIIVSFGTCARICYESVKILRKEGFKIGLFRPITLWPFPYKQLQKEIEKIKKIFVVEMNLGQMIDDVKISNIKNLPIYFYGRPGGGVPTSEEISNFIISCIKGRKEDL
ncbi:MAG: 3-methyl-2-oxobutanoate dehydrogenase subunit VorB [Candidatus Omnitrophica bacterium]|nr:3-methyl-2-oxobutanoate dehydrogenase subunit VorB [Candidatus Omnitrophota bacterium]